MKHYSFYSIILSTSLILISSDSERSLTRILDTPPDANPSFVTKIVREAFPQLEDAHTDPLETPILINPVFPLGLYLPVERPRPQKLSPQSCTILREATTPAAGIQKLAADPTRTKDTLLATAGFLELLPKAHQELTRQEAQNRAEQCKRLAQTVLGAGTATAAFLAKRRGAITRSGDTPPWVPVATSLIQWGAIGLMGVGITHYIVQAFMRSTNRGTIYALEAAQAEQQKAIDELQEALAAARELRGNQKEIDDLIQQRILPKMQEVQDGIFPVADLVSRLWGKIITMELALEEHGIVIPDDAPAEGPRRLAITGEEKEDGDDASAEEDEETEPTAGAAAQPLSRTYTTRARPRLRRQSSRRKLSERHPTLRQRIFRLFATKRS